MKRSSNSLPKEKNNQKGKLDKNMETKHDDKSINLISEVVDSPNAEWLVASIISAYGHKSTANASFVLDRANAVMQDVVQESERLRNAFRSAASALLQGPPNPQKQTKRDLLRWLVSVCVALAPTPRELLSYEGEYRFYVDELILLLKERDAYNPHFHADRQWAKENDYFQYLEILRIDLNIC